MKYAGAVYLLYLGIRTILSKSNHAESDNASPQSQRQLFMKGFCVQLLNPKTALFFYAFLPQFVDALQGHMVLQILTLGLLFVVLAIFTDCLYALISSGVGRLIMKKPRFRKNQRYITGSIYIGLCIAAASTGHGRK